MNSKYEFKVSDAAPGTLIRGTPFRLEGSDETHFIQKKPEENKMIIYRGVTVEQLRVLSRDPEKLREFESFTVPNAKEIEAYKKKQANQNEPKKGGKSR
jgi:hypothetical protein